MSDVLSVDRDDNFVLLETGSLSRSTYEGEGRGQEEAEKKTRLHTLFSNNFQHTSRIHMYMY